jgi:hypothetical protein
MLESQKACKETSLITLRKKKTKKMVQIKKKNSERKTEKMKKIKIKLGKNRRI